jgi:hypothetical protein
LAGGARAHAPLALLGHIADAFKDWRVSQVLQTPLVAATKLFFFTQIYLGGVIYFGANAALASISAFLPTIIKTFGYSELSLPSGVFFLAAKIGASLRS